MRDALAANFRVELRTNLLRSDKPVETILPQMIAELAAAGEQEHAFGMCDSDGNYYLFRLKDAACLPRKETKGHSKAWWHLDVSILHTMILEDLLGIGEEQMANQENLTYTRDPLAAARTTLDGTNQLAFFLNPTRITEILEVAGARDKMPQKSTFFYPKLITGLVINPLGEEGIIG